jgi:hypothetical protein
MGFDPSFLVSDKMRLLTFDLAVRAGASRLMEI